MQQCLQNNFHIWKADEYFHWCKDDDHVFYHVTPQYIMFIFVLSSMSLCRIFYIDASKERHAAVDMWRDEHDKWPGRNAFELKGLTTEVYIVCL